MKQFLVLAHSMIIFLLNLSPGLKSEPPYVSRGENPLLREHVLHYFYDLGLFNVELIYSIKSQMLELQQHAGCDWYTSSANRRTDFSYNEKKSPI